MIALRHFAPFTLIAGLLLNPVLGAGEVREITWDDLVPAAAQFDDPYTRLDENQLYRLGMVAQVREILDKGSDVDEETMAEYGLYVDMLEEEGVDIDGLIAMREQVQQERTARTYLTNDELEGKSVRIPGFLLPLEFDGDRVTEFFLVPYVGACIHTPPPPPNQIVHVRIEQGFTPEGGLYAPVWVNGQLNNERNESDLSYVDGSAAIPSSYSIDATGVERYE